jgi:hypothetical protein
LLFHRGVIQHKGSTNAVKAFINSRQFIDASVDEFWAYKIAEYGDARRIQYPELVLNSRDTNNDKLSLDFPIGEDLSPRNFVPIKLDQSERWFNQPKQLREIFQNQPNLYFEAEISDKVTTSGTHLTDGVFVLPDICDGVKVVVSQNQETGRVVVNDSVATINVANPFIPFTECLELSILSNDVWHPQPRYQLSSSTLVLTQYVDRDNNIVEFVDGDIVAYNLKSALLKEGIHYDHVNSMVLNFNQSIADYAQYNNVEIYCLNPAKSKLNPVKFIDSETDTNIQNIPVWDPARGHHYHIADNIVNINQPIDPALYTHSLVGFNINRNLCWNQAKVGKVWWDSSDLDYVPYYDKTIIPDVDIRTSQWGRLAEYAEVRLFEWVSSPVPPSEYVEYIQSLNGEFIAEPRLKLYKRERNALTQLFEDNWELLTDRILKLWGYEVGGSQLNVVDTFEPGADLELYVNGQFIQNIVVDLDDIVRGIPAVANGDRLVFIERAYAPSDEELEFDPEVEDDIEISTQYKFDTEFTRIDRYNKAGTELISTYYFWAKNTSTTHNSLTLQRAESQLSNIPTPFVVFDNLQLSEISLVDSQVINLPDRYNRAIFRGMVNLVSSNNRFRLRFAKNFGFRDRYTDATPNLRSVNTEWKMIRERQKFNIPKPLWDKLTEAVSGRTLSDNPTAVPSLARALYDAEFDQSLRFGLRDGQAFVDKSRGLDVIIKSIEDPRFDLFPIDREQFLSTYKFDTPSSIEQAMNAIYTTFLPEHVNRIWFAALYEGLANNIKYTDIFKTSWIQLDGVRLLDTSGVLE